MGVREIFSLLQIYKIKIHSIFSTKEEFNKTYGVCAPHVFHLNLPFFEIILSIFPLLFGPPETKYARSKGILPEDQYEAKKPFSRYPT